MFVQILSTGTIRKVVENTKENMHIDIGAQRVNAIIIVPSLATRMCSL